MTKRVPILEGVTPGSWELRDIPSAGLQIYGVLGPDKKKREMVEYNISGAVPVEIYGLASPYNILISSECWVQFSSKEWDEMQKANGNLISKAPELAQLCAEMAEQIQSMRHNTSNTCQCDECEDVRELFYKARALGVTE